MEIKTVHIVSIGLTAICICGILKGNNEIAVGALTALAGWLGGNSNGKKEVAK